jgi:hypothetical protein
LTKTKKKKIKKYETIKALDIGGDDKERLSQKEIDKQYAKARAS